jgi:TolB-like protein
MPAEGIREKAKVIVLSGFCLLNPFAGWAYLAQARHAKWLKPPSISDTLKPRRLAVLPLVTESNDLDDGWAEGFEVDFAEHEDLEVVPLARTPASLDVERDVLALGRSVRADFVLDARALADGVTARVYVRLIRTADPSVRWSDLLEVEPGEWLDVRDRVRFAVLSSI